MNILKLMLNPFFSVKFLLCKDIEQVVKKNFIQGNLLDIGCGNKPYKKLFKDCDYQGIDFEGYSENNISEKERPDFFFDKEYLKSFKLPFGDETYGHTVSFQVIEHHQQPSILIEEMKRITKRKGLIIISAPFFWPIHEKPNDYFRFSYFGLYELAKRNDLEVLEVKQQGGFFVMLSSMINSFVFENKSRLFQLVLLVIFYLPFQLFQYISILLDFIFKTKRFTLNYVAVFKKK